MQLPEVKGGPDINTGLPPLSTKSWGAYFKQLTGHEDSGNARKEIESTKPLNGDTGKDCSPKPSTKTKFLPHYICPISKLGFTKKCPVILY